MTILLTWVMTQRERVLPSNISMQPPVRFAARG